MYGLLQVNDSPLKTMEELRISEEAFGGTAIGKALPGFPPGDGQKLIQHLTEKLL